MSGQLKQKRLFVAVLKKCLLPIVGVVLLFFFYGAYTTRLSSRLELDWHRIISKSFFVLAVIVISFWVKTIVTAVFNWYAARLAVKTKSTIDDEFTPLFKSIASIIVWAIALIIILSYLGVNINALIATLGVGSLAIALAAQDTIANVISGFLILIDRPFKVGDQIKLPSGEKVKSLSIGIRRSKFLSEEGAVIIVPNLDLSKSKIVNYTYERKEGNR